MTDRPSDTPNTTFIRGELAEVLAEDSGGYAQLNIGGEHHLGPFPQGGLYRIAVPVTAAVTRAPCDSGPPPGPWLRVGVDGIRLVTPPGELDPFGNTTHQISRDRALEMIRTLQWMVDTRIEVVSE